MPKIEITEAQALSLTQGKVTAALGLQNQQLQPRESQTQQLVRFYTPNKRLFGVGEVRAEGVLKTHKMFVDID